LLETGQLFQPRSRYLGAAEVERLQLLEGGQFFEAGVRHWQAAEDQLL